jgi:hypothetical protein
MTSLTERIAALPQFPTHQWTTSAAYFADKADCYAARLALAREALLKARPIIEADARMMADLIRHAPLDAESQAIHDSTEYDSEKLVAVFDALLAALEVPNDK